jgi:hypothetical protein
MTLLKPNRQHRLERKAATVKLLLHREIEGCSPKHSAIICFQMARCRTETRQNPRTFSTEEKACQEKNS